MKKQISKNDLSLEIFRTKYTSLSIKNKKIINTEYETISQQEKTELKPKSLLELAVDLKIPLIIK